jgi:tetratricopeptide (TPR) repeat protein
LERATAYAREGLALYRELGDLAGIASSLTTLARLTYSRGDFSSASPLLEEALAISRELGDQIREDEALITYGTLAYWQGDYPRAKALYEEGIVLGEKIGYYYQNLWAQIYMAYTILRQGDLQTAREMFADGIREMRKADLVIGLVFALEGLASLYAQHGQSPRAVQMFAWTNAMRGKIGDPRPPIEQASIERDLAFLGSQLDASQFENLSAEGRSMTMEQAIALALED